VDILKIQRTARIAYLFVVHPVQMANVQLPTHVHATVVIIRIQRTARIVYLFADHSVPVANVLHLIHAHVAMVT
jgi:hypothetical protein